MMPIKTIVICACLVLSIGATKPDILTKRDSSVEVDPYQASADPYQAYYAQYDPSAVEHPVSTISEKQGFAGAMENVFGDDAALVLGTIGALMGTLAAVGVVLNNNNINELSLDQDAICTAANAVGDFDITASAVALATATDQTNVRAEFDRVINAIEALKRPTRCQ